MKGGIMPIRKKFPDNLYEFSDVKEEKKNAPEHTSNFKDEYPDFLNEFLKRKQSIKIKYAVAAAGVNYFSMIDKVLNSNPMQIWFNQDHNHRAIEIILAYTFFETIIEGSDKVGVPLAHVKSLMKGSPKTIDAIINDGVERGYFGRAFMKINKRRKVIFPTPLFIVDFMITTRRRYRIIDDTDLPNLHNDIGEITDSELILPELLPHLTKKGLEHLNISEQDIQAMAVGKQVE
tara:strand:- start:42 stop:740 length:699 start_codon:yes stop_codon:yes gene_type:complete